MLNMHTLRAQLPRPTQYPKGVLPTRELIEGTAFFPGGHGLWMEDGEPHFPVGGIMVLGHDFHSEAEYTKSLERGKENLKAATWRELVLLLEAANIKRSECFYTNFYMGLRETTKTTGVFAGSLDPAYVQWCQQFFLEQLRQQRPRLILVLGLQVPKQLAPLADALQHWSEATKLKDFNAEGMAMVHDVRFKDISFSTTCIALAHPSQRRLNIRHRTYMGETGQTAELLMIKDGLAPIR